MAPRSVGSTTRRAPHPAAREPSLRAFGAWYPAGGGERDHAHPGWHQLVYAAEGFFGVHTPSAGWVVPPARGVWLPDGTTHRLTTRVRSLLHTVYIDAALGTTAPELAPPAIVPQVVHVSPLVRELIAHVVRRGVLHVHVAADRHVIGVLLDELTTMPVAPLALPQPADGRCRAVADRLRADPSLTIDEVAAGVGASRRTVERGFADQAGMSLGRWRRRAQMLRALELLAAGQSVTVTGLAVGFSTTSAFVAAFRRELGTPPGRYFGGAHRR